MLCPIHVVRWFTSPDTDPSGTDAYIRSFAEITLARLHDNAKIYVEWRDRGGDHADNAIESLTVWDNWEFVFEYNDFDIHHLASFRARSLPLPRPSLRSSA